MWQDTALELCYAVQCLSNLNHAVYHNEKHAECSCRVLVLPAFIADRESYNDEADSQDGIGTD